MSNVFDDIWASDDNAPIDTPSAAEIRQGFRCGPVTDGRLNWLFQMLMSAINSLGIGDMASKFRLISTTEGIQGGGNLEVDRTLRFDFAGMQEETTIADDDLVAIYDTSVGAHRKMTKANLVTGLGGGGGSLTGAANVGTGDGEIYVGLSGSNLQLRKIKDGNGIDVTTATNDIVISLANMGGELTIA